MSYAWSDPEFWGARGFGCAHCIEEPHITSFSWGRLGFRCVALWFPGRTDAWLLSWFERQATIQARRKGRKKQHSHQLPLLELKLT